MAKEKKVEDPFEDLGRDDKIASGDIRIDPRFIDKANITELVQLCNLLHPEMRAHPGISRRHLEEAVLSKTEKKWRNPVDRYRKLIGAFFTVYWKKIKDQIDPKCGGDCYKCHDLVVLSCYITNHKRLKQFRSERAIRED